LDRIGAASVLDGIGNTPLVRVEGVWAKLEYLNPSGSIKARIAKYMVEREGLLKPGDTIVEASSGNTGNALSMVAAVKGYRMLVVMPEGLSSERATISRAFGAEVLEAGHFHVNEALATMRWLAREYGMFVGPSSGAHLVAARRIMEEHPERKTVVTLFCDEGEKYISEHFRDAGGPHANGGKG
jgi:cysteine synthase